MTQPVTTQKVPMLGSCYHWVIVIKLAWLNEIPLSGAYCTTPLIQEKNVTTYFLIKYYLGMFECTTKTFSPNGWCWCLINKFAFSRMMTGNRFLCKQKDINIFPIQSWLKGLRRKAFVFVIVVVVERNLNWKLKAERPFVRVLLVGLNKIS